MPMIVGISAGRIAVVLMYIAIPIIIPAMPRKIDSFVMDVFVVWVYKVLERLCFFGVIV